MVGKEISKRQTFRYIPREVHWTPDKLHIIPPFFHQKKKVVVSNYIVDNQNQTVEKKSGEQQLTCRTVGHFDLEEEQ